MARQAQAEGAPPSIMAEPDEWKQEHLTVLFVQENFDIMDLYSQEAESRCGAIRPVHLLIRDLGNAQVVVDTV